MGFGAADTEGWTDETDVALVVPLPSGVASIDLVRRDDTGEVVVDTLALAASPITVRLTAPTIPVPVSPGDRLPISWLVEDSTDSAAAGAAAVVENSLSYILVSPDNGSTWIPIAGRVPGGEFEWEVKSTGRYMIRVFSTVGFETDEDEGLVDSDFDGCPDTIDQTPLDPDPDGPDGDGIAEICDNCPGVTNRFQLDPDDDSIGSACDNCPEIANFDQFDGDLDGWGDVCDCDPQDGGVFAKPGSITRLVLSKNGVNPDTDVDMSWDSQATLAGAATFYDVIAGKLAGVMGGGLVPDDCPGNDLPSPGDTFSRHLPPGEGVWYLARGQNSCGDGSWNSGGTGQFGSREGDLTGFCP